MPQKSRAAPRKQQLLAFFANLERELEQVEFFRPPESATTMLINLRNIFARMQPTQQDMQTLHGVVMAIAEGRKGPARGGVLDSEEAASCARCSRSTAQARVPRERGPVRGLARLLRRNPTDAERALWDALTKDRRFAGLGFKRQTPVGPHIADFVSFPLRLVIDIVPDEESEAAAKARAEQAAHGSRERGYRVVAIMAQAISNATSRRRSRIRWQRLALAARPLNAGQQLAQPLALISATAFAISSSMVRRICWSDCATPLASKSLRTLLNTSSSPASSKSAITTSLA